MPIAESSSAMHGEAAPAAASVKRRSASAAATTSSIVRTPNTGSFGSTARTSRRSDSASIEGSCVRADDQRQVQVRCLQHRAVHERHGAGVEAGRYFTSRTTPTIVIQLIGVA